LRADADGLIANRLAADVDVLVRTRLISPEQAAEEVNAFADVSTNAHLFGWSLEMQSSDQAQLNDAKTVLRYFREIEDIDDGAGVLARVTALQRIATLLALAVGILLVGASLFVVNVTMSLALAVRQEEIRIQKIVGASDSFVIIPLVGEAVWAGLLAALVALPLLYLGFRVMNARMATTLSVLGLPEAEFLPPGMVLGLVCSFIVVAVLGTLVATARHLARTQ
jgi:cell division protein FtsX